MFKYVLYVYYARKIILGIIVKVNTLLKKKDLYVFILLIFSMACFLSCTPLIKYTSVTNSREPKPASHDIIVYPQDSVLPKNIEVLGNIYVGDTGFSTDCGFDNVLSLIKEHANISRATREKAQDIMILP